MNRVVVGLGSNINPDRNLAEAQMQMAEKFRIVAMSPIVETAPVGYTNQPNFKNGTVLLETPLSRENVQGVLKRIETNLGRERGVNRYGPRTIDLDVVVWNGRVVDPTYYTRDFLRNAVLAVLPDLESP
jgi:2-amino-4-hydroxy-6-hydroxymethyldihydropteridine diphosphokinase